MNYTVNYCIYVNFLQLVIIILVYSLVITTVPCDVQMHETMNGQLTHKEGGVCTV